MADCGTQLDAIETTGESDKFHSYRTYRSSFVEAELKATEELYSKIDFDDGKDRFASLSACRKYSWFARNLETNRVHVVSNSCRLRWCPLCSSGRTGYIIHNLTPWMQKLKEPRFMTLTMKHTNDSLSEQIGTLYAHFRTLRKHKWFRKHTAGGVWFFQIKLSKRSDQWHPHLHCILHGKYIPKMELSKRWEQITNGSKIVDIKLIRDPIDTAKYVARYSARPANLASYSLDLRVEIFVALHGRRLAGAWGTAKEVSLSPPTCVDNKLYEKVGTWNTVTFLRRTDPDARDIFKAWLSGTDLDPSVSCLHYDNIIDHAPFAEGDVSDEYIAPYLPFF